MFAKSRISKTFRHYVSKLTCCIDIGKINYILLTPVTDDMVFDIHMLSALRGHVVGSVVNASLIILMEKDWFTNLDTDFEQKRA